MIVRVNKAEFGKEMKDRGFPLATSSWCSTASLQISRHGGNDHIAKPGGPETERFFSSGLNLSQAADARTMNGQGSSRNGGHDPYPAGASPIKPSAIATF